MRGDEGRLAYSSGYGGDVPILSIFHKGQNINPKVQPKPGDFSGDVQFDMYASFSVSLCGQTQLTK
ncbi:MAG: hypothetical protein NTY46_11205 [Candidatus Sumerlaeota bacterium]|nr:hypothetical protein [Candidatus Sumerlaeota bacterium]